MRRHVLTVLDWVFISMGSVVMFVEKGWFYIGMAVIAYSILGCILNPLFILI